jgi:hypothetical protein
MTEAEKKVLNKLVEAHNAFIELAEYHPSDITEWVHGMHALQNIVMSREAVRNDPVYFSKSKSDNP